MVRVRPRVQLTNFEPTITKQCFKNDCDINKIIQKYRQTGQISHQQTVAPLYLDITDVPLDYGCAVEAVQRAEDAFMTLPAVVRKTFDNDPEQFCKFVSDPKNLPQLRRWGLAKPEAKPEAEVEVVKPEVEVEVPEKAPTPA